MPGVLLSEYLWIPGTQHHRRVPVNVGGTEQNFKTKQSFSVSECLLEWVLTPGSVALRTQPHRVIPTVAAAPAVEEAAGEESSSLRCQSSPSPAFALVSS